MKLAALLAVFVVIGCANASPLRNDWEFNELDKDIYDFFKLLPVDQLLRLTVRFRNDPDTFATLKYISSQEFHSLLRDLERLPEFKRLITFVQNAGYNQIRELKAIHILIGMEDYVPPYLLNDELPQEYGSGGFNRYLSDMKAILPDAAIQNLHNQKEKNSPAFIKFHSAIHSEEYKTLKHTLESKTEYKRVFEGAMAHGLDIRAFENFKYYLLGFLRKGV